MLNINKTSIPYRKQYITNEDTQAVIETLTYYIILPQVPKFKLEDFVDHHNAEPVEEGFRYNSGENDEWETVESLRKLVKEHVDPTFKV